MEAAACLHPFLPLGVVSPEKVTCGSEHLQNQALRSPEELGRTLEMEL